MIGPLSSWPTAALNYMAAGDAAFFRQAYGDNYGRLVDVKRRYDPENIFHLNFNIDPS